MKLFCQWLRGFVCTYHSASLGLNTKHTIYTFFNLYCWNWSWNLNCFFKSIDGVLGIGTLGVTVVGAPEICNCYWNEERTRINEKGGPCFLKKTILSHFWQKLEWRIQNFFFAFVPPLYLYSSSYLYRSLFHFRQVALFLSDTCRVSEQFQFAKFVWDRYFLSGSLIWKWGNKHQTKNKFGRPS